MTIMLLGKRPRPDIKRTASMSEVTFDLNTVEVHGQAPPPDLYSPFARDSPKPVGPLEGLDQRFLTSNPSPRNINRRRSADFLETPDFLQSCRLCTRRLAPGRDIYMYRGDSAFCSLECRQQQMSQDERKEKCSIASKKVTAASAAGSKPATTGETVAAV